MTSPSSRQKIFQVEGIVLGKFDRSERDTVFSLLTKERGRMLVLAKYAKKVPSRHNAGLDLFNVVRCQLYDGRFLPVVTQVQQIRAFDGLFSSLTRLELAYKFAILLDALLQRGQESEEAYALTLEYLDRLATDDEHGARVGFVGATFRLLGMAGSLQWSPVCQQCGVSFHETVCCLSSRFLCGSCGSSPQACTLPATCYRFLHHAAFSSDFTSATISQNELATLSSFLHLQVAELAYPSYLDRVSFVLVESGDECVPVSIGNDRRISFIHR
jgi:DNA repair protein RecO